MMDTDELLEAWRFIAAEHNQRKKIIIAQKKYQFPVGSLVRYRSKTGRTYYGELTKVNRTRAELRVHTVDEDGSSRAPFSGETTCSVNISALQDGTDPPKIVPKPLPEPDLGRPFP